MQQVLSPYHAMGCNPVSMVDPLGLQATLPSSWGMGSPTAMDIALWQVPTQILDRQYGFNIDPVMQYNRLLLEAINGPSKDKSGKSGYGTTTTLWEALLRGEIGSDGYISHVSESSNMVVVTNSDGSEMGYTLYAPSEGQQQNGGRPDDDGYLTYAESVYWYRYGNGEPLNVDLGKISVPGLYVSSFNGGVGSRAVVNLIKKASTWDMILSTKAWNDAKVYGNLTFKLYPNNEVKAFQDKYDFEMHSWSNPINWLRNAATVYGDPGAGTPYKINFYGTLSIPLAPLPIK